MIDIGVNLLSEQFAADREELLARAWAAGLRGMIITASDVTESIAAVEYCAGSSQPLACTAGIHPHNASPQTVAKIDDALAQLQALAQQPMVAAIGETGLDYFRNFAAPEDQRTVCRAQLELAAQMTLPVFAHERDAAEDLAALINASGVNPNTLVVHCFTGTATALARHLEMGCMIGITGWICDRKRGASLRELVSAIPLERLLIETDAPYLRPHNAPKNSPSGTNRRRNEPALLPYVVATLAQCLDATEEEITEHTNANALRLFPRLRNLLSNGANPSLGQVEQAL